MDRLRRSRLARRWLVAFGAAAAGLLIGLSALGFGDAEDAARLQVEREAAASAQALQGEWERRLESPGPLAEEVLDSVTLEVGQAPRVAPPLSSPALLEGSDERLYLIAARADAATGDFETAVNHALEALRASPALSGEALITLVQVHRSCDELEGLEAVYRTAALETPFDSAVDGTSGRLLAFLGSVGALPDDLVASEIEALAAAAAAGGLALPPPRDVGAVAGGRFELTPDSHWAALELIAHERFPSPRWDGIFQKRERRAAALAEAVAAALDEPLGARWRATPLGTEPGNDWLMGRRDGALVRAALVDGAALDLSLARSLPGGSGFRVEAFGAGEGHETLAGPVDLAGVTAPLSIVHPSSAALLGPAQRRIVALRFGLVALAGLLLLSTFAGARTLARSERLDLMRSTFVASVSHDLRTPIASIGLMAENMANGYASGSEERYVESIQRETARLRRLVDDLLDFGRIERGLPPRLQLSDVQLAPWLDGFEAGERARCHASGCSLTVERVDVPASARLDVAALERALSNLVDNALKHAKPSAVTLRVRGAEGAGEMLTFEVEDDGAGLSKSALGKDLFEPFQRMGESAGTGLGLTIVRAIAEAHSGSAWLRPGVDGRGACATLTIATAPGVAA